MQIRLLSSKGSCFCIRSDWVQTRNWPASVVHVQFIHRGAFDAPDMCQSLQLGQTEDVNRGLGSSVDNPLQLLYLKLHLFSCRGHQRITQIRYLLVGGKVKYTHDVMKLVHANDE